MIRGRSRRSKAAQAAGLTALTVGRHGDFLRLKRVEHERHRARRGRSDGDLHEIDLPLAGDFQISNAWFRQGPQFLQEHLPTGP
jgi:UDP-N-acetylmuramoyl-L-alanyl-D-glutamate--2,6-diaminopimelate ligase